MSKTRLKAILDFDGTLTDESKQATELAIIAKQMLAQEIFNISLDELENIYQETKKTILASPSRYSWMVNGLPATYAYEGAYLLNTSILQTIMRSNPKFMMAIESKFPATTLDSITLCANEIFHKCSFHVSPHFLPGARELLINLIESDEITPVILTNSESRKIAKNLVELEIGEKGTTHGFKYEIEILGDTRQYHMDPNWDKKFAEGTNTPSHLLLANSLYRVDLRRPIYHEALLKVMSEGYDQVVIAADGFSLAGALPIMMGLNFILKQTDYTPKWSKRFVSRHKNGRLASDMQELELVIRSFVH